MPIKGVSEIVRLPRLSKVRLGIRKEGEQGPYPSATDYFVCPQEVQGVFGEKPKELQVMFPTEDESQWSSQYLKCYSASRGLLCRGDGETAIARVDVATGETARAEARETGCERCPATRSATLELLSRFAVRRLPPYTREKFRTVVEGVLVRREGCSEAMAPEIASLLDGRSQDVRDAVRVARLASQVGVERAVELLLGGGV